MSTLRIRLFGGVQLTRGDVVLPPFATQRARSLFAYLTVHRAREHTREVLIGVLWGEEREDVARKALRTALWRVRKVTDEGVRTGEEALRVRGQLIGFNNDAGHWVDVAEFEELVKRARASADPLSDEAVTALRQAVELYRGDALDGMYDDWCLLERERLRLMYLDALETLLEAAQDREDWGEAISLGQRLLHAEPLREHVHRDLMRCHARQGNRPAALLQYEECVRTLDRELGIEPMEETTALYRRIRDEVDQQGMGREGRGDRSRRVRIWRTGPELSRFDRLLADMDAALENLKGIRAHLEESRSELREIAMAAAPARRGPDGEDDPGTSM